MKSNKFWIIIFGSIIVLSLIIMYFFMQISGDTAKIYLDSQLIESIDLSAVREPYTIETKLGEGTNTIEIEQGRIRMATANCRDSSCLRQGWNSGSRTPIVCLPNRLIITVESSTDSNDIDAIVG